MLNDLQLILCGYLLMSATTFAAFFYDKQAAQRGELRTPERTLHLLEVAGGFPGALAAMTLLRHKNRKLSYVAVTVLIATVHAAAWGYYVWKQLAPVAAPHSP